MTFRPLLISVGSTRALVRGLLPTALLGAATGGRSLTGPAALTLTTPTPAVRQPDKALSQGWVKALVAGAAAAEIAVDKLPGLPSRLQPAQFSGRLISAALVGVIAARRMSSTAPAGDPA